MKKKLKLSEQCSLHGCIERLQSLVDGLKAGSFSVEHGDQTIVLRPGGHLDFDLRVDQNDKNEVLRLELGWHPQAPQRGKARRDGAREHEVALREPAPAHPAAPSAASAAPYAQAEAEELELELEWELEEDAATQRRFTSDDSTAPLGASGPIEGARGRPASGEPELVAPPFARAEDNGVASVGNLDRKVAEAYEQVYLAARTVDKHGRYHLDTAQLVRSLAALGVDDLAQQELYNLAQQAAADGRSRLFKDA